MPNWCANSLKLVANDEDQRNTINFIRENCEKDWFGLFNYFVPCPDELINSVKKFPPDDSEKTNQEKYGYASWYDFNISNWGTKWDASNICIEEFSDNSITITFDTAWSPPEQFYHDMHANGWELTASFIEQGCNFIGYFRDGETHSEDFNDGHIDYDSDTCYEDEDSRINDYFSSVNIDHYPSHTGG